MARRPILPEEVGNFSIDDDTNELFWQNEKIHTAVDLKPEQKVLAGAVAIFAILSAIATCTNAGITFWSTFYKKPMTAQTDTNKPTSSKEGGAKGMDSNSGPVSSSSACNVQCPPSSEKTASPSNTH